MSVFFQSWKVEIYLSISLLFFFLLLMLFSFFELSFFSLTKKKETAIKNSVQKRERHLKFLLQFPAQTLGTLLVLYYIVLIITIISSVSLLNLLFAKGIISVIFYYILIFFIIAFVILLVGEFIPDQLKKRDRLSFLYFLSGFIRFLFVIFSPLVKLFLRITSVVQRRLEIKSHRAISIDELSETLQLTAVEEKEEKEILRGIVNFGRISVSEIMKPRVDIVDVDLKSDFETVMHIIRESEYSRLPVYEDSIDNVKGILYIKDLLRYIDQENSFNWQVLVREAYFVPETKKIDDLLKEFQTKHIHMAIIVDEFGGTSGIVTLEDILEVIVGDICDEHDEEQKLYTSIDEWNYVLEGKLLLNDFYKIKHVNREKFVDMNSNADTLAGLILEMKGAIPVVGEVVEYNGYLFKIVSADNRRIKKVEMQIL